MTRVGIVEDESLTRRAIALALRDQGFEVHEAADAHACKSLLRKQRIDVLLLDLGLPGLDGLEFASQLRDRGEMGLIIVTRQTAPEARIRALDIGADDFLTKPIHYGELAARIRSVMRRCKPQRGRRKKLGRWIVDLESRTASADDVDARLTRGEFEILARLIGAGTKIISRDDLLAAISRKPLESDLRSVDALVSRIRRKLDSGDESLIATAPGFGYRLSVPAEDF